MKKKLTGAAAVLAVMLCCTSGSYAEGRYIIEDSVQNGKMAEITVASAEGRCGGETLVAALYDREGRLLGCKSSKIDCDTDTGDITVCVPTDNAAKMKVFILDSMDNLIPISGFGEWDLTMPTAEPTETPTSAPTETPTVEPAQTPTAAPTEEAPTVAPSPSPTATAAPTESGYAEEVARLVNESRAENGLSQLTLDATLSSAATARAEEITQLFSHTRPDGTSCFTVLGEYGVTYSSAGENIAYGQSSPSAVMESWMNSQGHRANILGEKFTKIGVGVYRYNGVYYWVQVFTG